MKRRLWGSFLVFLLAACSSSPVDLPQAGNTFSFAVDPAAQSVDLVSTPAALSNQAEDGSRVLVPGEDLSLESYTFVFLPGNVLTIDAVFKNVSDQTFTNLRFTRGAGSSNVVNSTEPDVVATLAPGASTGTLRFEVQHRGQSFSYEVEATATVETGGADCADPVTIPDEVLRQAVRDALNKPEGDITCADMASLTELRQRGRQGENGIPNRFVENLEGLQYAVNLTTLQLMGNLTLNDVTLLSTLTELIDLDLSGNRIGDIGPLSTLVNLTRLDLGFNLDIEDVSPLSGLTGLETLVLNINQITDITPLSGLVNLRRLDLGTNFVADLGPLVTNEGVGNDDDRIDLRFNCLDVAPGSQALDDVDTIENRNTDLQNVFLGTQRESDEDCGRAPPPPPAEECTDPVTIPDDVLERTVREALDKPTSDITCADMARLTRLEDQFIDDDGFPVAVDSLQGLQFATNLTSLTFAVQSVRESVDPDILTPLRNLENLSILVVNLNDNGGDASRVISLEPLSKLTSLTVLQVLGTPVKNINPLSGLPNLAEFRLENTSALEDYSALQTLPNLQVLGLAGLAGSEFRTTDISFLEGLTGLTRLDLSRNDISDISPLSSLTNLSELDLSYNKVSDISRLSDLTNLSELDLTFNQVSDVSPLSNLINLKELRLPFNKVTDIKPLSDLEELRELDLSNNEITDVGPLRNLKNLARLFLTDNDINDISPLSSLTNLSLLFLAATEISDVNPLSGLTNLDNLDLSFNTIDDIGPLSSLVNLNELKLDRNQLTDIGSLSNLTNLRRLDLEENFVRDLSPLVANSGLGSGEDNLDLRNNCLDISSGSQASQDVVTIEARNPSVNNVFGFKVQRGPSQCN